MSNNTGKDMKRAGAFILLTFSLNYLLAFLFYGLGGRGNTPQALIMAVTYMFVPMTVAIILHGVTGIPGFIVLAMVNLVIFLYDRYRAEEKVDSLLHGSF